MMTIQNMQDLEHRGITDVKGQVSLNELQGVLLRLKKGLARPVTKFDVFVSAGPNETLRIHVPTIPEAP